MAESLETKAFEAVVDIRKKVTRIDNKVTNIDNVVRDLSMKLCHIIKHKGFGRNYYTLPEGIDYDEFQ